MLLLLSTEAKGMIYPNKAKQPKELFAMIWQVRDVLNIILIVTASSEHRCQPKLFQCFSQTYNLAFWNVWTSRWSSSIVQGQDPASSRNQLQKGSISVDRKFEGQSFYFTSGLSVYLLLHITQTINMPTAKRVAMKLYNLRKAATWYCVAGPILVTLLYPPNCSQLLG